MYNLRPTTAVAVGQFAPGSDQVENLRQMASLAAEAVDRGAALVVFPEYSSFFEMQLGPASVAAAEALDGPFVTAVGELARQLGIHIVAGMLESGRAEDRASNTLVAVAPSGDIVAVYRKLHLYDAFGQLESEHIIAGEIEPPQTFVLDGLTVGMQTCYDIRFPEVTRRLADAGADVVLVPAEWVRGPLKEYHWRTLLIARAIENTVYVLAADHAPPIGVGNSMIVDPMGVELATIGETTDVAVAWLDPERLASVRGTNPALALRRFGVAPTG